VHENDDRIWLEDLYRRHATAALRYALSFVACADAEDLVHATFLDAWTKRDRRDGIDVGWVLKSVRFRALNLRRRTTLVVALDEHIAEAMAVGAQLDAREDLRALLAAWDRLTDGERELCVLADVLGLKPREIAQLIDRTPSATYQALARARKRLGVLYDEAGGQ
jgi:RNA polymerase sigma-70 factor (ECF subfamily)